MKYAKKSHKLIVLKGQNAQEDLKKAFKNEKYHYKLEIVLQIRFENNYSRLKK